MTNPPDFVEHKTGHIDRRSASAAHEDANRGDHRDSVNVAVRGIERRRRPPPDTPDNYLRELPASILLDRLPIPMLAVRDRRPPIFGRPVTTLPTAPGPPASLLLWWLSGAPPTNQQVRGEHRIA